MKEIPIISLDEWDDISSSLFKELKEINHSGLVLFRNFSIITYSCNENDSQEPTDRLQLAKLTGTDRDLESPFWNESVHDFEHDKISSGKTPSEIIYAHVVEVNENGYFVHYEPGIPEEMDLLSSLDETHGLLVYDEMKLKRVSKNEHWFKGNPIDALLMIFKLKE